MQNLKFRIQNGKANKLRIKNAEWRIKRRRAQKEKI
jgi:hypothetical protein